MTVLELFNGKSAAVSWRGFEMRRIHQPDRWELGGGVYKQAWSAETSVLAAYLRIGPWQFDITRGKPE